MEMIASATTGQLAALGTAVCWTGSALFFAAAGRRVGSMSVNLVRLVMAWVVFSACAWVSHGNPFPQASSPAWLWLVLSGLVGFTLGDLCLFRAFVLVGPRVSMLIMSLAPPMTALIGWLTLGETLTGTHWVGMCVTLSGVIWVVTEQGLASRQPVARGVVPQGVALAFVGALGQAGGLVLGKIGLRYLDAPFAATHIRVTGGLAGFVLIFLILRAFPRIWRALHHGRAMAMTAAGALMGPFLGVSLLMLSIRLISTGLAQTFVALTPVLIIPFSIWLHGEHVSRRAVLGALLAFAGIGILFL